MKNEKDHLPIYGPGPVFGGVVIALTVAAMFCRNLPVFQCGNIASLRIPLIVIGILLILFAIFLWVYAVIITKIDDGILHNHLVTTGTYALVRNPIYSAILILCTGVLMIGGNVLFLILPFLFKGAVLAFDACNKRGAKMMMKPWLKEAGITDVSAFFSVEDETALQNRSIRFHSVTAKSYMRGYRDIYKEVNGIHKLLIKFCDNLVRMKIIRITFEK